MKTFRPPALLTFLGCSLAAHADVKLPALISDNMVLQQDAKANVWGTADAGEKVTVKLGEASASATAGEDGRWSVKLEALKPHAGAEMTIAGKNTLTVKNVAVGEVWLGSGQSNMQMAVSEAKDADAEKAAAHFPDIRVFSMTRIGSKTPLADCTGKWEAATPETVGRFTAAGYFFARALHAKLKQPVGIIHASWGGTPCETWIPESGMRLNPRFGEHWAKKMAAYPAAKEAFDKKVQEIKAAAEKAKADGKPAPKMPRPPEGPETLDGMPSGLFNGMIAPVTPFTIRGAIWYQGESNTGLHNRGSMELYGELFPVMILSWRHEFAKAQGLPRDEAEFPFLFVQLANYFPRREQPTDSHWAFIREAQTATLEVPRTGMAVTIDIGDAGNIHPKNKQEVGRRLALNALAQVYFQEVEYSGPLYQGMQREDSNVRLDFSNAEGLKTSDGGPIKGFALAGEDKKFHWASATIEHDHVIVSCPDVPKPVAVRYGWADNPEVNLVNEAGLPASPFRSDRWKQEPPAGSAGH